MNDMVAAANNTDTSDHVHPNPSLVAAYLYLGRFNLVVLSSMAM
jgi:hypothetical protein